MSFVMKRQVTKEEMLAHVAAWPRPLKIDVLGTFDPPLITYNDFTLGKWPDSVIASLFDDNGVESGWTIHRDNK